MEKSEPKKINGSHANPKGKKFLTFLLAKETYGVDILAVREIIALMEITPIPCAPEFVLGVINLRGKIIPVVDLRMKFNLPAGERKKHTCIIVVDLGAREMGILVDSVSEVLTVPSENLEALPPLGEQVHMEFILGMAKTPGGVVIVLDIQRVLRSDEIQALPAAIEAAAAQAQP